MYLIIIIFSDEKNNNKERQDSHESMPENNFKHDSEEIYASLKKL